MDGFVVVTKSDLTKYSSEFTFTSEVTWEGMDRLTNNPSANLFFQSHLYLENPTIRNRIFLIFLKQMNFLPSLSRKKPMKIQNKKFDYLIIIRNIRISRIGFDRTIDDRRSPHAPYIIILLELMILRSDVRSFQNCNLLTISSYRIGWSIL